MSTLTLKGIPETVMQRLRERAHQERRSLNQQAILLLEQSLAEPRPTFFEAHQTFVKQHGPPPFDEAFFTDLRDTSPARPAPFDDTPPA